MKATTAAAAAGDRRGWWRGFGTGALVAAVVSFAAAGILLQGLSVGEHDCGQAALAHAWEEEAALAEDNRELAKQLEDAKEGAAFGLGPPQQLWEIDMRPRFGVEDHPEVLQTTLLLPVTPAGAAGFARRARVVRTLYPDLAVVAGLCGGAEAAGAEAAAEFEFARDAFGLKVVEGLPAGGDDALVLAALAEAASTRFVLALPPGATFRRDTNVSNLVDMHERLQEETERRDLVLVSPMIEGRDELMYYPCYERVNRCSGGGHELVYGYHRFHREAMLCEHADGDTFLAERAPLLEALRGVAAPGAPAAHPKATRNGPLVGRIRAWGDRRVEVALAMQSGVLLPDFWLDFDAPDLVKLRDVWTCSPGVQPKMLRTTNYAVKLLMETWGRVNVTISAGARLAAIRQGPSGFFPWDHDLDMHSSVRATARNHSSWKTGDCRCKEMKPPLCSWIPAGQCTDDKRMGRNTLDLYKNFMAEMNGRPGMEKIRSVQERHFATFRTVNENDIYHFDVDVAEYRNEAPEYHLRDNRDFEDLYFPSKRIRCDTGTFPVAYSPGSFENYYWKRPDDRWLGPSKNKDPRSSLCAFKWKECV